MAVFQGQLTAARPWGAPVRGDVGMLGNPQRLEAACFCFTGQFVNRDRIVSSNNALQKCEVLIPKYAEPVTKSLTCLRDMVREGLAMVEGGSDPLPHLEAFATSVVSEDWFTLI